MEPLLNSLSSLVDPQSIITYGGVYLLLFVIFAETGLFFGFFLPGDSLLFVAGLFCATSEVLLAQGGKPMLTTPVHELVPYLVIAGVLGNYVGYFFGRRAGISLMNKNDTWFFKKSYVMMAKEFYEKHGGFALIMGRFLPIIRTFAPIFAGVVKMDIKKFTFYNVLGSVLWIMSFTLMGYVLGRTFPSIVNYVHYIIIGLVVFTTIPIVAKLFFKKRLPLI